MHARRFRTISEVIRARATRELSERVKEAAKAERVPIIEFIRRAVAQRIDSVQERGGLIAGSSWMPAPLLALYYVAWIVPHV